MMTAKSGIAPRLSRCSTPLDIPEFCRLEMSTGIPPSAMPTSRSPISGTSASISAVATSVSVAIMPLGFEAPRPNTQSSTICAVGCMSASPASPVRIFSAPSHSR
ncbi:hypothetical protein D3C85_1150290 [compost metagenome]